MNKQRRKKINVIIEQMHNLITEIEQIKDDEETAFENLPDSLTETANAKKSEEAIDTMVEVIDDMDTTIEKLNEAIK